MIVIGIDRKISRILALLGIYRIEYGNDDFVHFYFVVQEITIEFIRWIELENLVNVNVLLQLLTYLSIPVFVVVIVLSNRTKKLH